MFTKETAREYMDQECVQKFIDMISVMRPSSSYDKSADYKFFLEKFIEPYFGKPDKYGNYVLIINDVEGNHPRIAYMAHHDTVHSEAGDQLDRLKYYYKDDQIFLFIDNPDPVITEKEYTVKQGKDIGQIKRYTTKSYNGPHSSCLGADCTTGIWLILEMIETACPGVYVIHARGNRMSRFNLSCE